MQAVQGSSSSGGSQPHHCSANLTVVRAQRQEQPWVHATAGMLGGAIAMSMFYPLDFLRTRMHTLHQGTPALPFRSVQEIVQAEGLKSMYRGIGVSVVSHSLGWGMYLLTFRYAQRQMDALFDNASAASVGAKDFLSACAAATVTGAAITPLHVIKTRRQLYDAGECQGHACTRQPTGIAGVRAIIRSEGVSSMFRGVGPQILLTGNTTIQVTLYETIRRHLFTDPENPSTWQVSCASALSKAISTALFNPLEVVRTRLQDKRNRYRPEYRSMAAGLRTIWQLEGMLGLYRGLPVNVLRVIPSTVMSFVLYEKCVWALRTTYARATAPVHWTADSHAAIPATRRTAQPMDH